MSIADLALFCTILVMAQWYKWGLKHLGVNNLSFIPNGGDPPRHVLGISEARIVRQIVSSPQSYLKLHSSSLLELLGEDWFTSGVLPEYSL